MNPNAWILGGDTGTSSKTIWAVMTWSVGGARPGPFGFDVPYDPADFGRCYRLLALFPQWRTRLNEVSDLFPKWGPMVAAWDKMTELYLEELPSGRCPKLYKLMCELLDDCRSADGMVKAGPGCWTRESGGAS